MRVELRNVHKRFGKQLVLRDVSAVIEHGERVALVGPNGSGKSTLLRAIMGLLRCEGEVLLDGRCPFRHRTETARRLAYVPQVAPQLGASAGALVSALCALRELPQREVLARCERLGLPPGPWLDKPFRALSGGMKHKLLLGIALAVPAELYILDEPTASLDVDARQRFSEQLDEVAHTASVIVCSHRLDEIGGLVTSALELADGRVARRLLALPGGHGARAAFAAARKEER